MKTNFFGKQFISINDKLIVCFEKGRKYTAINKGEKDIIKIHVDNELITSGERCDYALNICNEKKSIPNRVKRYRKGPCLCANNCNL